MQLFEDLIYSEKTESYPWPMYMFFLCYSIGRLSSYTVIYLRLKQMLENSIFSYQKKTYNKTLFMLTLTGILGLTCITGLEGDKAIYYILLCLWIISDITYFSSVTFMYLSKLREIKNIYKKSVSQRPRHEQMSAMSTTASQSRDSTDDASSQASINISPQEIRYDCDNIKYSKNNNIEKVALELANIVSIYTKLSSVIFLSSFCFYILIEFHLNSL